MRSATDSSVAVLRAGGEMQIFMIAISGTAGVLARYFFGALASRYLAPPFPYGTFAINIIGAFLIGVVHVIGAEKGILSLEIRAAITIGFLGGFTTFSAYCFEGARLLESGKFVLAASYLGMSSIIGVVATLSGFYLGRRWIG
jgi:CrcB protein